MLVFTTNAQECNKEHYELEVQRVQWRKQFTNFEVVIMHNFEVAMCKVEYRVEILTCSVRKGSA